MVGHSSLGRVYHPWLPCEQEMAWVLSHSGQFRWGTGVGVLGRGTEAADEYENLFRSDLNY